MTATTANERKLGAGRQRAGACNKGRLTSLGGGGKPAWRTDARTTAAGRRLSLQSIERRRSTTTNCSGGCQRLDRASAERLLHHRRHHCYHGSQSVIALRRHLATTLRLIMNVVNDFVSRPHIVAPARTAGRHIIVIIIIICSYRSVISAACLIDDHDTDSFELWLQSMNLNQFVFFEFQQLAPFWWRKLVDAPIGVTMKLRFVTAWRFKDQRR